MKTIKYKIKNIESSPLFDIENKIVSVMIDGEMIDVPQHLFDKLFEEEKYDRDILKKSKLSVQEMKYMTKILDPDSLEEVVVQTAKEMKNEGYEKDFAKMGIDANIKILEMDIPEEIVNNILDRIYKE